MSLGEKLAPAFGRGLIAMVFLFAALGKLQYWEGTADMMADQGLPYRYLLLALALLIEVLCGFAVLIGFRTRMAAILLFAYVLAVNYLLHDFWALEGAARTLQLQLFIKNMGIAGGLLLLVGHGAGDWSVDHWRGE